MSKVSYLRKLIKEELSHSMHEDESDDSKAKALAAAAKKAQIEAIQAKMDALKKDLADAQASTPMNEDDINERMPYISGERDTAGVGDAIASAAKNLKDKFPEATPKDIAKIVMSKKKGAEFAPEVKVALDKQADEQADNPTYTFDLGFPQTLKAVEKALGLVKPKVKKENTPAKPKAKAKSKAKETETDVEVEDTFSSTDDFDTSLPDDNADDKAASKAASKDSKAIKGKKTQASKLSGKDEGRFQKLSKGIKSKVSRLEDMTPGERAKSTDIKVLKQLINSPTTKSLFKAKGVDLKALTSSVIG